MNLVYLRFNLVMSNKINITWSCGIDASGYSSCARSYIKALYENDNSEVKVRVDNVARNINSIGIDKEDLLFFSSISTDRLIGDNTVNHGVPDRMVFGNKKNIMYTVLEMECSKRWVNICNRCDIIMTASTFCKEMMEKSGIKEEKIHIVPHCHDVGIWNNKVKPLNIDNLKDFNFLFAGDFTPRKNGDLLIENFIKTFEGKTDVSLTIKGYFNSFDINDQKKLLNTIRKIVEGTGIPAHRRPKIYFYGEPVLESLMPRFMASFDCLISPHRAEGWGLFLSQMQFLGKPVISTNYSGNLDFMDKESSYLIDIDGYEPVSKEMIEINPNFKGQEWPIIDVDSLCYLMDYVYINQDEALKKGEKARKKMVKRFSYKPVSNAIIDVLKG